MGFILLGAAVLALMLTVYVVAAAEEGLWPFHWILSRAPATLRSNQPSDVLNR